MFSMGVLMGGKGVVWRAVASLMTSPGGRCVIIKKPWPLGIMLLLFFLFSASSLLVFIQ